MIKSKRILTIFCLSLMMFLLSACGEDAALEEYKTKMEDYFSSISSHSETINSIDPYAMDATNLLLSELDAIQTETAEMATWEVPNQFDGVGDIAAMAADDMKQAVSIYHQLYESENYDPEAEDLARQYYQRSNKELQAILSALHGEEVSSEPENELDNQEMDEYQEDEFIEDEFMEDEFPEENEFQDEFPQEEITETTENSENTNE